AAPSDSPIGASPSSVSAAQGGSAASTIATSILSGSPESLTLSATGVPTGTTASFSPNPITAGSSSTLTFTVDPATTPGTYSVTVTGTAPSATHSTTVTLTITTRSARIQPPYPRCRPGAARRPSPPRSPAARPKA